MLSLIHSCAVKAKMAGFKLDGQSGNNWLRLASACGIECNSRKEARRRLVDKFGSERLQNKADALPEPKSVVVERRDHFLLSYEWKHVRMMVLKRDGAKCRCCGASSADGKVMHVDHIKPRRTHPHLALDLENLQVLCAACNHGKGSWDTTDWRQQ